MPAPSAVTVRVLTPMLKLIVAPASAVPLMAAVCSLSLTMLSVATALITGVVGVTVSTVMLRVPAALTLPAASVAVADRVSEPCPMAVMSAAIRLYVQLPDPSAVTARVLTPMLRLIVAPASAVPLIAAVCSAPLILSLPATWPITGAGGARVSMFSV